VAFRWWVGLAFQICFTTIGPSFGWDLLGLVAFGRTFLGLVPYGPLLSGCWRVSIHLLARLIIAIVLFGFPLLVTMFEITVPVGPSLDYVVDFSSGFFKGLAFALGPYAVHGVIFYVFSQVSHIQSNCHIHLLPVTGMKELVSPEETYDDGASPHSKPEWAVHQVLSTLDYAPDSTMWLHLSNGLNHQIAHHLFQQVDWIHYPQVSQIIAATAREFGVDYKGRVLPTFGQSLKMHLAYLRVQQELSEQSCFHPPPSRRAHAAHLAILGEAFGH